MKRLLQYFRWLYRYSEGARGALLGNILLGVATVVLNLVFIWMCKSLVDIATKVRPGPIGWYTAAVFVIIGLRLIWQGVPDSGDPAVLTLFLAAAREAMANAAKHAGASVLTICAEEDEAALSVRFTNDGTPPARPVAESGGLATLRRRLEAAGGRMDIRSQPVFCLAVTIPKGGTPHAV